MAEPAMKNETPDLVAVMKAAITDQLNQINVALPAMVQSYDKDTQKAIVQPLLMRKFKDSDPVPLPPVSNVPIMTYRVGDALVSLPIKSGATGVVFFSQRSLEKWLDLGGIVSPDDPRTFDLSDGMFYPGLYPFTEPHSADPDKLVVMNDKLEIELSESGTITITNTVTGAELLDLVSQALGYLAVEPFITNKAAFAALKVLLDTLKG